MHCEPLVDRDVLFNARVKIYPDDVLKYTVFNKLIFNPDKYELINKISSRDDFTKSENPVTRDDSIKRAKDKIFDICFINSGLWTHFVMVKNRMFQYLAWELIIDLLILQKLLLSMHRRMIITL